VKCIRKRGRNIEIEWKGSFESSVTNEEGEARAGRKRGLNINLKDSFEFNLFEC